MRCYFMRNGHIAAVELLTPGPDEALIEQGKSLFRERPDRAYDGFEVWDGVRRLHSHPPEKAEALAAMDPDSMRIKFACPHCGQKGEVVWDGENKERVLVSLTDGFHVEEGRLPGAKRVIICDKCDEIDPPRVSPKLALPV